MNKQLFNRVADIAKDQEPTRVEFAMIDDFVRKYDNIYSENTEVFMLIIDAANDIEKAVQKAKELIKLINDLESDRKKLIDAVDALGIGLPNEADVVVKALPRIEAKLTKTIAAASKSSDIIFSSL